MWFMTDVLHSCCFPGDGWAPVYLTIPLLWTFKLFPGVLEYEKYCEGHLCTKKSFSPISVYFLRPDSQRDNSWVRRHHSALKLFVTDFCISSGPLGSSGQGPHAPTACWHLGSPLSPGPRPSQQEAQAVFIRGCPILKVPSQSIYQCFVGEAVLWELTLHFWNFLLPDT